MDEGLPIPSSDVLCSHYDDADFSSSTSKRKRASSSVPLKVKTEKRFKADPDASAGGIPNPKGTYPRPDKRTALLSAANDTLDKVRDIRVKSTAILAREKTERLKAKEQRKIQDREGGRKLELARMEHAGVQAEKQRDHERYMMERQIELARIQQGGLAVQGPQAGGSRAAWDVDPSLR